MTEADSPIVAISPLRETLRLYCRALAERDLDVLDLRELIDKNIGWTRDDVATSDGAAIFLPAVIERFEQRGDNLALLKVMVTQQSGHLEFGSFDFQFARPSRRFVDLRPKLRSLSERDEGNGGALAPTELSRYFKLFPNKRLAFEIFAIVEGARIEASVLHEYRGIAPLYRVMRERALRLRQEIVYLPAREALLEFMIQASLGRRGGIKAPVRWVREAVEIVGLLQRAMTRDAAVEDAAEATLRIYAVLSRVANDNLNEGQFTTVELEDGHVDSSSRSYWPEHTDPAMQSFVHPFARGREGDYCAPQGVDYRGEFNPELAQLLNPAEPRSRQQRQILTREQLAQLLRERRGVPARDDEEDGAPEDPRLDQTAQNLMQELERRDSGKQSTRSRGERSIDDGDGPLTANEPGTYVYDEWDFFARAYRPAWCKVHEKEMAQDDMSFYRDTLTRHAGLVRRIRREFEMFAPELYRKERRLADGADHDLDAAIEAMADLRIGVSPSEKLFWRHHREARDAAVAFLLDMSGSTGEALATVPGGTQRRIIDVEKEAMILMIDALEAIGDCYGVFGFSGHGRDQVEFYIVKDFAETFSSQVAKRVGRVVPLHATRMGPAIRHATLKLRSQQTRSKFLFLISDGRPQDVGYSQESAEKVYAVQDTRMALIEARREGITPFCLTVDKDGNDYLGTMMDDFSYEVLADVDLLPQRLPQLYRRLTG